ncbi:hypothetical protein MSHOH_2934 [Methanosarcina horonobensis HB-1 = JCM 15518]|uniref:Uncharacterized protein n=1 Tax=Methanosarcina horonobensis HB-1 = JCM 15518 TaxID=1434110 RepID=A0A0E3SGD9_9EURY|nr:AraC family transcriptional regulator [Methanosarcina horonobensis]AKB79417.1 hypothetical protein MSHOH_2934 [Methanosarcina horonobensis HB-1 = JCM 15518]
MGAKVNVDLDSFKWLYTEGLSDRKICKILGLSRYTLSKIRSELGLTPNQLRKKTVFDFKEFKRLYAEGKKDKEIAKALGFSLKKPGIHNEIGLPPLLGSLFSPKADETEFFKHYQQGKSTK